jgi:opacity protein-like surface antigen
MNKILKLFLVLQLLVSVKSFAQEEDAGGSPYSIFGIGDITNFSSNRTYSMGILGTSLFGNYVNSHNPAALAKLRFTDITFAMNYGFFSTENASSSSKLSNGNVLGFNIGIPISQGSGWVMALGFNPVTIVNTKVKITGNTGQQNYVQTYASKGGLSRINAGMSYTLLQKLTLGLEYNYGFGEIKSQNFINFNNSNFVNTNIKKELDFNKSYMKAGAILEVGKLLKSIPLRDFTIGFAYQSSFGLKSSEQGIYGSAISVDTTNLGTGVIEIPSQLSFGLTNVFGRKYIVSGDFVMQDWGSFSDNTSPNVKLGSSYRAGLGIEIIPSRDAIAFFNSMTYRLGGFYEKSFYQVAGNDINNWGVRAGVNIPMSDYSSLDLGVNYSQRGTTSNGLVKDQFLNFTATINFGELWFIRPREEDQ